MTFVQLSVAVIAFAIAAPAAQALVGFLFDCWDERRDRKASEKRTRGTS